ncbi:hypothetical protein B0H14DRAFT_3898240, partial [Mycena olivaceomarginata]
ATTGTSVAKRRGWPLARWTEGAGAVDAGHSPQALPLPCRRIPLHRRHRGRATPSPSAHSPSAALILRKLSSPRPAAAAAAEVCVNIQLPRRAEIHRDVRGPVFPAASRSPCSATHGCQRPHPRAPRSTTPHRPPARQAPTPCSTTSCAQSLQRNRQRLSQFNPNPRLQAPHLTSNGAQLKHLSRKKNKTKTTNRAHSPSDPPP